MLFFTNLLYIFVITRAKKTFFRLLYIDWKNGEVDIVAANVFYS